MEPGETKFEAFKFNGAIGDDVCVRSLESASRSIMSLEGEDKWDEVKKCDEIISDSIRSQSSGISSWVVPCAQV